MLCFVGGHATGDLTTGEATSSREGKRTDRIVSAEERPDQQIVQVTPGGGQEELLLLSVWWGMKD